MAVGLPCYAVSEERVRGRLLLSTRPGGLLCPQAGQAEGETMML